LKFLNLHDNQFGTIGSDLLFHALSHNPTLTRLYSFDYQLINSINQARQSLQKSQNDLLIIKMLPMFDQYVIRQVLSRNIVPILTM
jgi:hypothetical protein